MPVVLEIQQGKQVPVGTEYYIRAFASIPSVGPSFTLEFIAVEALAAVAAVACPDIYLDIVNEHLF
jgi:hypothetical protein